MPEKREKGKHLNWDDRNEIQRGLRERRTFTEIALVIGCALETISKEIRAHRYHKVHESRFIPNRCKHRESCRKRNICNKKPRFKCKIPCRQCTSCNRLCPDFVDEPCKVATKAPYVCNGCYKSAKCLFDKYLYSADYAQKEYRQKLHESRMGINLTRDELAELDTLVSPLIKKGQPIAHIMATHGAEIPCRIRTLYYYIDKGYLSARNIDMRRTVRYKKRRQSKPPVVNNTRKENRHYEDFQRFLNENPEVRVTELDTVEGTKGGKLLMTLLLRETNLMLAYLIENKEMTSTLGVMDELEDLLGTESYRELFGVILTDNGLEFAEPLRFETGKDGVKRTEIYYCDPRMSNQKGCLERNHEYIRYILPKGTSFDELTQEKVMLMINHINNTARPAFNGLTPMKLALQKCDVSVLEKLGLKLIPPDEVCLKPELLK